MKHEDKQKRIEELDKESQKLNERAQDLVVEFLDMFDEDCDEDIFEELRKIRERYQKNWSEYSELVDE